jgi:hypothetical protein
MKIFFGTGIHKAQIVMELDLAIPSEKITADKIMQGKRAISIQNFIAADETSYGAVIIWDGLQQVQTIVGSWIFHHQSNSKYITGNYFEFRPLSKVKNHSLDIVDTASDEYYIYYTFSDYKKL